MVCKTINREFDSHRALFMQGWSRNQARLAHNQEITGETPALPPGVARVMQPADIFGLNPKS